MQLARRTRAAVCRHLKRLHGVGEGGPRSGIEAGTRGTFAELLGRNRRRVLPQQGGGEGAGGGEGIVLPVGLHGAVVAPSGAFRGAAVARIPPPAAQRRRHALQRQQQKPHAGRQEQPSRPPRQQRLRVQRAKPEWQWH